MKNVTLSVDEKLLEAARARAREEKTTLNEAFRRWLVEYVRRGQLADAARETIAALRGRLRTGGRKFTRDEMNEH